MQFLEKNLEDIIFETPNHLLQERGLYIKGFKKRQVRIGNYGIADLITFKKSQYEMAPFTDEKNHYYSNTITIYELKQKELNLGTFNQALRYYRGVERYFEEKRDISMGVNINIVFIGQYIEQNSSFCYLSDFSEKIRLFTYKYDYDGIKFTSKTNFSLVNEVF